MKIDQKDLKIDTFSNSRDHVMTITHMPTGLMIKGDNAQIKSIYRLRQHLIAQLEEKLDQDHSK